MPRDGESRGSRGSGAGADAGAHAPAQPPGGQAGGAGEVVIAAHNLGKRYQIYRKPQDRLKQGLLRWSGKQFYRDFWALKGVSFEVKRGEAVGVLGRNGAGKSTLLQLIAGTLAPSEGDVSVRGRVPAMLQLGSGFSPEFTGRENVYLAGSILGIPRREMESRFDAIASFADIGAFMDQPLKTYSSGMGARLAFAVSFSVEPDLLIVDEILAVGDIGFQQKCVSRLRALRDNGLTMLFVSHSPDAVRSVCNRALFLVDGQMVFFGPAEQTTNQYLSYVREQTNKETLAGDTILGAPVPFKVDVPGNLRYGTGHAQIERVEVLNHLGEPTRAFRVGDQITLEATLRAHAPVRDLNVSFLIRDMTGIDLMGTTSFDEGVKLPVLAPGETTVVRFEFENRLRPGNFGVCMAANRVSSRDYSDTVLFDQVDGCAAFVVMGDPERPVHYKFHQPVSITVFAPAGAMQP